MRYTMVLSKGLVSAAALTMAVAPGLLGYQPDPQVAPKAVRTSGVLVGGSFLGVNIQEVDGERAKALKLKDEAGVEVTRIEEDSPASKAGLKVGDVVLEYNGTKVDGIEQFSRLVRETPVGREVKLSITRDGHNQTVIAKIGSRKGMLQLGSLPRVEMPEMPAVDIPRSLMMWRSTMLGIEGEALRGQLADFFGVKEGVLVRSVMKDTPAAKAGLKAGDVIIKVDDAKVTTTSEISGAIRRVRDRKSIPLLVLRDHKEITITAAIDDDRSEWQRMEQFEDMPIGRVWRVNRIKL